MWNARRLPVCLENRVPKLVPNSPIRSATEGNSEHGTCITRPRKADWRGDDVRRREVCAGVLVENRSLLCSFHAGGGVSWPRPGGPALRPCQGRPGCSPGRSLPNGKTGASSRPSETRIHSCRQVLPSVASARRLNGVACQPGLSDRSTRRFRAAPSGSSCSGAFPFAPAGGP
jgi:hypothetical protein